MTSPSRVAAIDCGTNSIRLLIADVDPMTGQLDDVVRRMEVVRLGQGVDRTGELAPQALARTLAATREYAAAIAESGAVRTRFVATSATRDARNRDEFAAGVFAALRVMPEIVTGDEEATLSFRGATGQVAGVHRPPYLVVDLGGGSTELVLGEATPQAVRSMDVGCVRLTERHLRSNPPSATELAAARADVRAALDQAGIPFERTGTLVGLAGSVTTVTAHALGLSQYDRDRINGAVLDPDRVIEACEDLLIRDHESLAALGFMHPGRVDVIGAGALVWSEIVRRVRDQTRDAGRPVSAVVTSEHDILDGIALSLG